MFKRCVFIIVAVLGFSVIASASLSTEILDEASIEESQSGILDSADFVELEEEVVGSDVMASYSKRNRRHRRHNRGYSRGHRRHNRGYNRGHHRRNRRHHRRPRHHYPSHRGFVCYSQSYQTGQQFWGAHHNLHQAQLLANKACYDWGHYNCGIITCRRK